MVKQQHLKKETVLIAVTVISLFFVMVSVIYIINLQHTVTEDNRFRNTALRMKDNEINEQVNYIDTICGEYRKLYSAYIDLSRQGHSATGTGYILPGSAKGDIDECYQLPQE